MSDESKYNLNFGGTFESSQFVVGDNAQVTMNTGAAASRLDAQQLEELRAAIATLAADVAARAPEDRRDEALRQVQELTDATIAADEVDVPRLKRVTRWFAKNAPELAEAVTGLLFGPAVAALVGKAGGLATALLAPDDGEPGT
jgi:aminoglycoside phosphotransferase (APT) family kinase protein